MPREGGWCTTADMWERRRLLTSCTKRAIFSLEASKSKRRGVTPCNSALERYPEKGQPLRWPFLKQTCSPVSRVAQGLTLCRRRNVRAGLVVRTLRRLDFDTARPAFAARVASDTRPSAARRGYDGRWRKYRIGYITRNPFCVGYPKGRHGKRLVRAHGLRSHRSC